MPGPALVWFRDDFRISDNPAFHAAAECGAPVLCFAVIDEVPPGQRLGGATRWWLHGSLSALADALRRLGSELRVFRGEALELVERIARDTAAERVFWNRRYAPAGIQIDAALKQRLTARGIAVRSFNGRLLNEPWTIRTRRATPSRSSRPIGGL